MIQNLVYNLCESFVVNIGGVSGATPHKVAVATPVISLTGNSVTITCDTTGATIYYTLDGSTPTSSSSQYSSAFTLDSSCTIKAIAIKGGKSSAVAEESYVKPITYLTQWKIVGNSEVHGDEYLKSWKVSGNSVVDNNAILSCGDLGQDGKYHVKISNGSNVYDIALTEPLRKVNAITDSIEFANGVATLTRRIKSYVLSNTPRWLRWTTLGDNTNTRYITSNTPLENAVLPPNTNVVGIALCAIYPTISVNSVNGRTTGISIETSGRIGIYDADYAEEVTNDAFVEHIQGVEVYYQLATPTTETIQVSPIAVSPTDTYTSANVTPYSAFEHTEHKEIWSCGEYNATDGKYHILVQPQGGSIADIALTEPLRKVNNVADSIEFSDSSEIVRFASYFNIPISNINYALRNYNFYDYMSSTNTSGQYIDTGLCIGGTDSVDFRVKFFLQNAGGWFGAFDGESYMSSAFYGTDFGGSISSIALCCGAVNAWNDCNVTSGVNSSLYLIKTYAFTKMPSFNGANSKMYVGKLSNATYTPIHEAFIFARNNAGTPSSTRLMSVYSLIVHGKGVFIVAKRKSDNAIGLLNLFDSNPATQLHTNQGSGDDFTLGSQITFEQLCSDIMDGYPDAPTETNDKALLTIRVEESGGELSPLDTPTTELVDAPQIEEAESYTCVISQGGKAVEWSSFETE